MNPDTERSAQEIVRKAAVDRTRPSRTMWVAALAIGAVCIVALAIGFATSEREATRMPSLGSGTARPIHRDDTHGYNGVFVIGAAAIIIASLAVARRR